MYLHEFFFHNNYYNTTRPYNRTLSNIAFTISPVKLLMHNTIFCIQNHYTAINVTSLPTIRRISMYVDALNK